MVVFILVKVVLLLVPMLKPKTMVVLLVTVRMLMKMAVLLVRAQGLEKMAVLLVMAQGLAKMVLLLVMKRSLLMPAMPLFWGITRQLREIMVSPLAITRIRDILTVLLLAVTARVMLIIRSALVIK